MRHWLPRLLIIASLGLHVITAASYIRQPDLMAAFTVYPIWMWSLIGLILSALAFLFWRAQLSLMLVTLWLLTILTASDESHALANIGKEVPELGLPKTFQSQETIRVCTLNWGAVKLNSAEVRKQAEMIAAYKPDILFMQEITPWHAEIMADIVYPVRGDFRADGHSATLTKWQIHDTTPNRMLHSHHTTLRLPKSRQYPDGRLIDCVNFHLKSAITDMRLWQASCWKRHSANRKLQRKQVIWSLTLLQNSTPFPTRPVVVAGDLNAPASDPLHDLLRGHFTDSFNKVGAGWANTWHRRIPFQRIDYIYTSPLLRPVRSRNVVIPASDHLMVVSDFILLP